MAVVFIHDLETGIKTELMVSVDDPKLVSNWDQDDAVLKNITHSSFDDISKWNQVTPRQYRFLIAMLLNKQASENIDILEDLTFCLGGLIKSLLELTDTMTETIKIFRISDDDIVFNMMSSTTIMNDDLRHRKGLKIVVDNG